jgi:hypothetical protein
MVESVALPAAFAELEHFASGWALPSSDERMHKRMNSSMAEIQAFYDTMLTVTEGALAYLDQFELGAMPPSETRLFHLVLAGAEAALAVEVYRAPQLPLAPTESRVKVTHTHKGD